MREWLKGRKKVNGKKKADAKEEAKNIDENEKKVNKIQYEWENVLGNMTGDWKEEKKKTWQSQPGKHKKKKILSCKLANNKKLTVMCDVVRERLRKEGINFD